MDIASVMFADLVVHEVVSGLNVRLEYTFRKIGSVLDGGEGRRLLYDTH